MRGEVKYKLIKLFLHLTKNSKDKLRGYVNKEGTCVNKMI